MMKTAPMLMLTGLDDFDRREKYRVERGFVRVSLELAYALRPYCIGTVVEVMAGTGHLSAELIAAGVKVLATDDMSWHLRMGWEKVYAPVQKLDAIETVVMYGPDTVLMVWPYMDSAAHRVAMAMKSGASLLYCGEGCGGCTANDDFFELMSTWQRDDEFSEKVNAHHKQWWGLHDNWERYTKP